VRLCNRAHLIAEPLRAAGATVFAEQRANPVPVGGYRDLASAQNDPESATPDEIKTRGRAGSSRFVVSPRNPRVASCSMPRVDLACLGVRMSQPLPKDRQSSRMILGNEISVATLGLIGSAAAATFLQVTDDLGHNLERLAADIDGDRMLIRCRRLQDRELAIEQGDRHEVLVPRG
jgi:hypothetical protein